MTLGEVVENELPHLRALSEADASRDKQGWTSKEELGHLIDSAANNHIRFASAAIQGHYEGPGYAQDEWVALHGYAELPWNTVIDIWRQQNIFLDHLIARIPHERMTALCVVKGGDPVTLRFLIDDYILHLRHHVDHLLSRAKITVYPPL
jgi:hypothetical protein